MLSSDSFSLFISLFISSNSSSLILFELVLELLNKKEKKILYILNDSTIDNPSYSLLQNEIEKIENGKALNLEQSKKIYINNMKLRKKK